MKFSELGNSRFLKQDDIGDGLTLTISGVSQENLAQEGAKPEMAACFSFSDHEKMFVVKPVNGCIIMDQLGLGEDDDISTCVGCRVSFYVDHTIQFGGKRVGGIRVKQISRPGSAQRTTPSQATPAANGDAVTATARKQAWDVFRLENPGTDAEITPAWRALMAETVPGKRPQEFNATDWSRVKAAVSAPPSPLSEEPEFAVDDIPF